MPETPRGTVRIVDRAKGWTVSEIELYGGHLGYVEIVSPIGGERNLLVRLDEGPCAGERRWFTAAELVQIGGGDDGD
jgi:hypothetical protein